MSRHASRIAVAIAGAMLFASTHAATPLAGASRLGAGSAHACALVAGTARCWGDNTHGQLGNGTRERAPGATLAGGAGDVATLSSGHSSVHQCAVATGGRVRCWGYNGSGQLGDGTFTASLVPLEVPGVANVAAVVTGGDHTCVLTAAGGVKCWGGGAHGQLGDGNTAHSHVPVDVTGLTAGVVEIASGYRHTCARTGAGAVKCWGFNQFGQLGNGTVNVIAPAPVDVTGLASGATALGAGYQHVCAATASGVKCWGWNGSGQLGNGTQVNAAVPVDVTGLGGGIAQLALGQSHSCARTAAGAVHCWGSGLFGVLGDNLNQSSPVPVSVIGLAGSVVEIAAGDAFNCARLADGSVRCWGEHTKGQVGMGQDTQTAVPLPVAGLGATSAIDAGGGHACVAGAAGVKCWGKNWEGQIGQPVPDVRLAPLPVDVAGLPATITAIGTGDVHNCAIAGGGALWCWGANFQGQLGDGTTSNTPVPVAVSGLASGVTAVAAGEFHTCAIVNGGAKCWGGGIDGKLGHGSNASSAFPVNVTGLAGGVAAMSVGSNHSCALTTGGAVKCWGRNADGELGNGGASAANVPVDVSGLPAGVTQIAAGYFHTCALTASGGVLCWGYNGYGALGNGSTTLSRVPVPVTGLATGVLAITAGEYHSCALLADGPRCWGMDMYGHAGAGSYATYRLAPVATVGLPASPVTHLAAGADHTCARLADGSVWCWGWGIFGQLGNGGANSFPAPVPVVVDARCGAFTDVDAGSPFCPSVQWLRNRAVTLGCVAGRYCPDASVSRLAMAAFMNRLGSALGGDVVAQQEASGPLDPDAVPRLCTTLVVPELTASRDAHVDAIVTATAGADVGFAVDIVASVDGGATWRSVSAVTQRAAVRAGTWAGARVNAAIGLDVGRSARFALALGRVGAAGSGTLDDSTCNLRVRIGNRNGATLPY